MRRSIGLLVAAALLVPATPAPAVTPRPDTPRAEVLHRVVWDQYETKGTHLWSANPDGSDARKIYVRPVGFVEDVTLNRQGTEAAVAPVALRATRAALVVVDVMGGSRPQNLLADHPEIYFVGGIGWSPSGHKLVFEGSIDHGSAGLHEYLFTVRRDGTRLRRIAALGRITEVDPGVISNALAWTRSGVLYRDRAGLQLLSHGKTRTLVPGRFRQQITGDGTWLYLERLRNGRQEFWRLHPDGSGVELLYRMGEPGDGHPYVYDWAPSYDGSQMLSYLDTGGYASEYHVVTHDATRAPSSTDPTLPFSGIGAITWN